MDRFTIVFGRRIWLAPPEVTYGTPVIQVAFKPLCEPARSGIPGLSPEVSAAVLRELDNCNAAYSSSHSRQTQP